MRLKYFSDCSFESELVSETKQLSKLSCKTLKGNILLFGGVLRQIEYQIFNIDCQHIESWFN